MSKKVTSDKIAVAIIGGTGYGAGELLRLIPQHPRLELCAVISSSRSGQQLTESHRHLRSCPKLLFSESFNPSVFEGYANSAIFLAVPHGASAEQMRALGRHPELENTIFIDLSGDYRLSDSAQRQAHYPGSEVSDAEQQQFVYGLPEINRDRYPEYNRFATPGCLATVSLLASLPLFKSARLADFATASIVFDVKTGASGAGRKLQEEFHFSVRNENFTAYKILEHRHEAEIRETLGLSAEISTQFVPHLIPCSRGCFATVYCELEAAISEQDLLEVYREFYQRCYFVSIAEKSPEFAAVLGTNFCDLSLKTRSSGNGKTQVCILAALDNLTKGTAGQAIQSLNIRLGFPEKTGLCHSAPGPSSR